VRNEEYRRSHPGRSFVPLHHPYSEFSLPPAHAGPGNCRRLRLTWGGRRRKEEEETQMERGEWKGNKKHEEEAASVKMGLGAELSRKRSQIFLEETYYSCRFHNPRFGRTKKRGGRRKGRKGRGGEQKKEERQRKWGAKELRRVGFATFLFYGLRSRGAARDLAVLRRWNKKKTEGKKGGQKEGNKPAFVGESSAPTSYTYSSAYNSHLGPVRS